MLKKIEYHRAPMGSIDRKRLEELIDAFSRVRLLVVGDLVLDEYVWGEPSRTAGKSRTLALLASPPLTLTRRDDCT